jgi:kumamolisin
MEASIPKRAVRLSGTVKCFDRAFGVNLKNYFSKEVTYRGRTGHVYVPDKLAKVIEGVFGLDNRPLAGRRKSSIGRAADAKAETRRASNTFSVTDVAKLYNFPPDVDGTGQCIALIELNSADAQGTITGTGYAASDLKTYFRKLGRPMPSVSAVGVAGGANKPGLNQGGDIETTLDIEVAGAAAPGARIVAYFAPDTDAGFLEAVSAAVHDTLRRPSVISISWGSPEDNATEQFLKAMNEALQDAAALGVTVCCECGDHGSSDQPSESRDGQLHVEFPASSPFALACGGTELVASGATIHSETVWNAGDQSGAGGGGVSNRFPRPKYQTSVTMPVSPQGKTGRGLPDVAGNAVGYRITVFGKVMHLGGTSAVTPLCAGMIAVINQDLAAHKRNPVGMLTPLLYVSETVREAFRDVTEGNNDIDGKLHKYKATRGWDPCTGMGSPDATRLLMGLKADTTPKPSRDRMLAKSAKSTRARMKETRH